MKKYIAECIGVFGLVFCGTGAVIVNEQSQGMLGLLGVSITFGVIVMGMIYVFGKISGAHINPAVTIALLVGRLMPKKQAVGYIVAQLLGAFLASGLLLLIFPESITLGETLPVGGVASSFVLELVLTFFLMLIILGVTSQREQSSLAGIVIGVTVTGIILLAGPISGGSFNPARSIAPAILSGSISLLWIYIIGPVVGAIVAVLAWGIVRIKID
ncbi:MIP/aquaporin family protein [Aquimarina aquimarini]|uniref:MIP/aquaporin family protein n=1 Tax=Aquimarina aquimarini TaxID=1191734 RepID=UPI000D55D77D|nr:aquaporin [Aquimarina aquimarini]